MIIRYSAVGNQLCKYGKTKLSQSLGNFLSRLFFVQIVVGIVMYTCWQILSKVLGLLGEFQNLTPFRKNRSSLRAIPPIQTD